MRENLANLLFAIVCAVLSTNARAQRGHEGKDGGSDQALPGLTLMALLHLVDLLLQLFYFLPHRSRDVTGVGLPNYIFVDVVVLKVSLFRIGGALELF